MIQSFGPFTDYQDQIASKDQSLKKEWIKSIQQNLLILVIPEAAINTLALLISVPIISNELGEAKKCSEHLFLASLLGLSQCAVALIRIVVAFTLAWRTDTKNGLTLYVNISLPSWYSQLLLILISAIYSTYMLLVIPGDCREFYPS